MSILSGALALFSVVGLLWALNRAQRVRIAARLRHSVRHGIHVLEAAKIGADVMTAPPSVIKGLFKHVLTDKGIEGFLADWAKTGQSI